VVVGHDRYLIADDYLTASHFGCAGFLLLIGTGAPPKILSTCALNTARLPSGRTLCSMPMKFKTRAWASRCERLVSARSSSSVRNMRVLHLERGTDPARVRDVDRRAGARSAYAPNGARSPITMMEFVEREAWQRNDFAILRLVLRSRIGLPRWCTNVSRPSGPRVDQIVRESPKPLAGQEWGCAPVARPVLWHDPAATCVTGENVWSMWLRVHCMIRH
jgi:hypothetical protein